jgi:hypothetical protein
MLDDQGLFRSGPSTLLELCHVVGRLVALRGCECTLRVRVVAVPDESGGWQLFAGRMVLLDGAPEANDVVALGPLRLVTSSIAAAAASDSDQLRALLLGWLDLLGLEHGRAVVQNTFQVNRTASESAETPPSWHCDLFQHRGEGPATNVVQVDGPFLHESLGLLARTVGELAAQWLELPEARERTSAASSVTVTLEDPRAALGAIAISEDVLRLRIRSASTEGPTRVLAFLTDTAGRCHQSVTDVRDLSVHVPIPEPLRSIDTFLVDADGSRLDNYFEDEHRCSRRARVLYSIRTNAEDELRHALESGEGDQVEFKAWIPLDREKAKSLELFKTVCAFANASGGTLFIGVTDDLQLRNLDGDIRRALGGTAGPIEELRETYRRSLLQLLRQGIAPNVQVEAEWVLQAGLAMLRVAVAASLSRNHYVLEERTAYMRRGASNAKAIPTELGTTTRAIYGVTAFGRRHRGI